MLQKLQSFQYCLTFSIRYGVFTQNNAVISMLVGIFKGIFFIML